MKNILTVLLVALCSSVLIVSCSSPKKKCYQSARHAYNIETGKNQIGWFECHYKTGDTIITENGAKLILNPTYRIIGLAPSPFSKEQIK
jgi:hypothetical protein